jgi:hypothetical protein
VESAPVSYSPPPAPHPAEPRAWRLPWPQRLAMAAAGGLLMVLLFTASRLTPSPSGMGTHQRLGLPMCTIRVWYNLRCPSCGMTTSWAHLTRGNLAAAFRANAGGLLLGLASIAAGPWLLVSGLMGRWLWGPPHEWTALGVGLAIIAVTLIDWSVRLTMGW